MTRAIASAFPVTPLRRFIRDLADGPFGSSLTSSHYADEGARVIRLGNIGSAQFRSSDEAYIPLEYFHDLRRHEVKAGDLIIAGLGDSNHPVGRACLAPKDLGPAIVKADCFRARLDESRLTHRYAAWALSSPAVSQQIRTLTRGTTRTRINLDVVREIQVPVPSQKEQHRIADFLDSETARLGNTSHKFETFQDILSERFSSLNEQLFGTLVSPIDRGVRVKEACRPIDVRAEVLANSLPLLSVSIHQGVVPRSGMTDRVSRAETFENYKVCAPGDLVLNRMRAFQGAVGVSDHTGMVSPDYLVLRPTGIATSRLLHHIFRSPHFVAEMASRIRGIGSTDQGNVRTPRINWEDLREIRLRIPARDEQDRMVLGLDSHKQRYTLLREKISSQLSLLTERRQALITAAVTGQFDVSTASGRNVTDGVCP